MAGNRSAWPISFVKNTGVEPHWPGSPYLQRKAVLRDPPHPALAWGFGVKLLIIYLRLFTGHFSCASIPPFPITPIGHPCNQTHRGALPHGNPRVSGFRCGSRRCTLSTRADTLRCASASIADHTCADEFLVPATSLVEYSHPHVL